MRMSAVNQEQLQAAAKRFGVSVAEFVLRAASEKAQLPAPRRFSLETMQGWIGEDEAALASVEAIG